MIHCLLCLSKKVSKKDIISVHDIQNLYRRYFAIQFDALKIKTMYLYSCQHCGLKFFYPAIVGDAKFYNQLQNFLWYYELNKNEYMYAKKYINKSETVLEIGSGSGNFSKYLKAQNYIGIDIAIEAVQKAQRLHRNVIRSSLDEYVQRKHKLFDVVCSFQVLEHVFDPEAFLAGMLQLLAVNGKLIISVPSYDSFLKYAVNNVLNLPPHHLSWWSDKTLTFIAKKFKLQLIDIYHEPLADEHKVQFLQTLMLLRFMHIFHIQQKIVRTDIFWRVITFFVNLCAKLIATLFIDTSVLPRGQSVTVVYQKI